MCGINGIIHFKSNLPIMEDMIQQMNHSLSHRGPDASGKFHSSRVTLGHQRLSIIDISNHSNQPLFSTSKNTVVVFNGEIYNYIEIKNELEANYNFQTKSDTEVIVALYETQGIQGFEKLAGMFAFILYDLSNEEVFVFRDRLGIKPLYYGTKDEITYVSSEIRTLLKTNVFENKLNEPALAEYVCTQTVHEPYTLIQDIFILEPGSYLHFNKERFTKHKYYHLPLIETDCSLAEIRNKLRSTLSQSVEQHLRSDVNFGAFLSGGIDSSLLVALMHEVSEDKISTFNIAFKEDEFNESEYAKIIAKKYNTEHFEVLLNANDFLNEIPNAVKHIDFPSGDGPNTYVVTEAAKKAGLTVAVSGLGGDELFGGYPVFRNMHEIKKSPVFKLPKQLRKILSTGINLSQNNDTGRRKAAMLNLGSHNLAEIYTQFRTVWHTSEILNSNFSLQSSTETSTSFQLPNRIITSVSLSEIQGYMHDVLLRDSDQMSMAHAFEIRVPFLDHRVVECALEIPDKFKFPHKTKQFLTDTYSDILPSEIVNRPKMGFTLPWKLWMKNELKTYCEEGLEIISTLPLFDEKKLNLAWNDFLKGSNKKPFTSFWHLVVLGHWLKQNSISTP